MSFPSSFGTQVAAIMDVLAKAAVVEITKLVEDGTVVLRLEMCRKDAEIQELKRRLGLLDVELCKTPEAPMSRTAGDEQEQVEAGTLVTSQDESGEEQTRAEYLEPKWTVDSLKTEDSNGDTMPVVKAEPAEGVSVQEGTDNTATNSCSEAGRRDDPVWPPAACSMLEISSASMQQHGQMFPAHTGQFSAHGNTESSYNCPTTAAGEVADDSLSALKVEAESQPVCTGRTTSETAPNEPLRQVSCPADNENQSLQSPLPQPTLSLAVPHVQRTTADAADHNPSRNTQRTEKLIIAWRANQKYFVCSLCYKAFPCKSQLEKHHDTHQNFGLHTCLECGKSFTQKTRLKTHQSVHTGEKPFSCKICNKTFNRRDNCLRHERFHSGLKPYSCGQCGKSFKMCKNLKMHQEKHLQER